MRSISGLIGICLIVGVSLTPIGVSALPLYCGPSVFSNGAIATIQDDQAFLAFRDTIFRVDLTNGARSVVASGGSGATQFENLSGLDIDADGQLIVSTFSGNIIRVNPLTGQRTEVPITGPTPLGVTYLAVLSDGNIYVVDVAARAILRIDPVAGVSSVVSSDTVGSGPGLLGPTLIDDGSSGELIVADFFGASILRIDAQTGNREVVTSASVGQGPSIGLPNGLLVRSNDDIIVAAGRQVLLVDPGTGNRSVLVDLNPSIEMPVIINDVLREQGNSLDILIGGSGVETYAGVVRADLSADTAEFLFAGSYLRAIATPDPSTAYVLNPGLNALLEIDTSTGQQSIVSDAQQGSGPIWANPTGLALNPSGMIVVADQDTGTIFRVDPQTGDRIVVSAHDTHPGPMLEPSLVTVAGNGDIYLAKVGNASSTIYRVDPVTGERTIVSDPPMGSDPAAGLIKAIAAEQSGSLVIVSQQGQSVVARLNVLTGQREVVSGAGIGSGTTWGQPSGLTVASDGTIFVKASSSLYSVDPQTGHRTRLIVEPVPPAGSGPRHSWLAASADGRVLAVGNSDFMVSYDPVLQTRQLIGDMDDDLIADSCDNCSVAANSNQRDSNSDGFGNACDADLNNDCVVSFADLGLLKNVIFLSEPDADFDGNGNVDFLDVAFLRASFLSPPGPSAVEVCD